MDSSAEVEFILFTVAWCCVLDNLEVFQLLLSSTYRVKAFPAFHMATAVRSWQSTANWEGSEQTPADPRDGSQHVAPYSLQSCRKEEEHSEQWHFSSQVTITCGGALLPSAWQNTCLPQQVVNGFLHLLHFWGQLFLYFLTVFTSTHKFSLFLL